jgi:hypothetical protein
MAIKRELEGVLEEGFVFQDTVESSENPCKKLFEGAFQQLPQQSSHSMSHAFAALTGLEVILPKQLEQLLIFHGLRGEVTECQFGSWIQSIVQQPSFPKRSEVLEHIHGIILNNVAKRVQDFKQSLHPVFTEEERLREYRISHQLRINVGLDCIRALSCFLSQEDRQAGLYAAAIQNQVSVIEAFLDNGKCEAAEKQQVFIRALEKGWVDIFSKLAPEMLATRQARSSAMLIASANRHSELLEAILQTGPVAEKDRQQALEQATRANEQQIAQLLMASRSRLI